MHPRPQGTVTFVFTDVEGSTRLLQQLGDSYAEVARDHRRLVREALEGAGGTEIDRQGDAFFFSFARARDAVRGAVDAQRALRQHRWPDGGEVRVRMGLHTGELSSTAPSTHCASSS
jgi:class 3 adenylate cyclase